MSNPPKRLTLTLLNLSVLLAIAGFALAVRATFTQALFFLLAWNAMTGWIRIASGVIPTFERFPCSFGFVIAYVVFILVSTWVALDRLVMGNLPLGGVVLIFAYSGVPELFRQTRNPTSEIYSGRDSAITMKRTERPQDAPNRVA